MNYLHDDPPQGDTVEKKSRAERYEICKACPNFVSMTTQCSVCMCFMPLKTWFKSSTCPIGKW